MCRIGEEDKERETETTVTGKTAPFLALRTIAAPILEEIRVELARAGEKTCGVQAVVDLPKRFGRVQGHA